MSTSASGASGHGRFAVMNHTVNRLLTLVLRSPLHPLASRQLAVITVRGRRSGREHAFPVGYERDGGLVTIPVGWPERKVWWRNLRGGAPVRLRLRGVDHTGQARVRGDVGSGIVVEVQLDQRAE
jgi:hypothetical protein